MTNPNRNDWPYAEPLTDRHRMLVLWAIHLQYCVCEGDFVRCFGPEFDIRALVAQLQQDGLLLQTDRQELVLTDLGQQRVASLDESSTASFAELRKGAAANFESLDSELADRELRAGNSRPVTRAAAFARLSQICNAFEDAWNPRNPPRIDDYFVDSSELLRQLILSDLDARLEHGMPVGRSDYLARFPEYANAIEAAFSEHTTAAFAPHDSVTSRPATNAESEPADNPCSNDDSADAGTSKSDHWLASRPERYRNWEELEKGGLGIVYEAHDRQLDRKVAIKVNRDNAGSNASEDAPSRLIREAQITGKLEHKGIAPVFECGRQANHRPFYAMRLIEGINLKEGIASLHANGKSPKHAAPRTHETKAPTAPAHSLANQPLALRDYLRRFIDVCNTIAFAHSRGVLNCDIKPANIRLGRFGETFVVDWGMATLMLEIGSDRQPESNWIRPGADAERSSNSIGGTIPYMSPEQANNMLYASPPHAGRQPETWRDLDGRSDVYSLGATLFTLLTGKPSIDGKNRHEQLVKVHTGEVPAPRDVAAFVPKPLNAICRKAMSLRPDDRYATALELAVDIELWLSGECPKAYEREEPMWDKAFRWIRNNRRSTLAIAAGLLVALVSLGAATTMVDGARKREKQWHSQAISRYADARHAIDRWVTGTSEALRFFPGTETLRVRLLQEAARDYEQLAEPYSDDVGLEFEQGRGQIRLADEYKTLGDAASMALAEKHYLEAVDRFQNLSGEYDRTSLEVEIARAETKLGQLMSAARRSHDAAAWFDAALERLGSLAVTTTGAREILAATRLERGIALARDGDNLSSMREIKLAELEYKRLVELDGDNKEFANALAIAKIELGRRHEEHADDALAIGQYEAAGAILAELVRAAPDHPDFLDTHASVTASMANLHRKHGRHAERREAMRRVADSYAALHEARPDVPIYQANLAMALTNEGFAAIDAGESRTAYELLKRPHELYRQLVASHGDRPEFQLGYGRCKGAMGIALDDLEWQEGQDNPQELLSMAVQVLGELHEQRPHDHQILERLALTLSAFASASTDARMADVFEVALDRLKALRDADPEHLEYASHQAHVYNQYGLWLYTRGEAAMAATKFLGAREIWQALLTQTSIPEYQDAFAWFLATCPNLDVRLRQQAVDAAHAACVAAPASPKYCNTLAIAHFRAENFEESLALLEQAIKLRGIPNGRDLFFLAMARQRLGQEDDAQTAYQQGVAWMEANQPRDVEIEFIRREAAGLTQAGNDE